MSEMNASNLRLSRDMYQALFQDKTSRKLVESILGESGKVQLESGDGETDDSDGLAKLRAHLEQAALKGDGKIDGDEKALLEALDARNWRGTSEDVVQQNLLAIRAMQQKVASTGDPSQLSFELKTQSFEERLQGTATNHGISLKEGAEAHAAEGASCSIDAGACLTGSRETAAREALLGPMRSDRDQAVSQLREQVSKLGEDLAKAPQDKLRGDLERLGDAFGEDEAYVKGVLGRIGLDEAGLAAAGAPKDAAGLGDWLAGDQFKAWLDKNSPAALEQYRGLLSDSLKAYSEQPGDQTYARLREIVYDHSYVFENAKGVGEEAAARYKQFKQTLLTVNQQSQLLDKASDPAQLPKSLKEIDSELASSRQAASSDILAAAGQIETLIQQIEKQPALFAKADPAALRAALDKLVSRNDKGELTLKDPKPSQAHLDALNGLWAEIEELGLKAGLGDDFSSKGAMQAALAATAKAPGAAEDPARQILAKAPELAEYGDLLAKLGDPANKALLDAVMSNQPEAVSKFFSEYYSSFFDFKSMLGGLSGFSAGLAMGGPMAGLLGAGLGLGLSYGLQLFGAKPADGSQSSEQTGSRFSLGNLTAGLKLPELPGLGFSAAPSTGELKLETPGLAKPASGKQMNLLGLSEADVKAVAKLLAEKPEARALLQQHGSDLNALLAASPQKTELQGAIDAKKAFDTAFWSQSSKLEDAQASVQASLTAQNTARLGLDQAAVAVEQALASPNLGPEQRELLSKQQAEIAAARQALATGGALPAGSADLDRTLAAVRSANAQSGGSVSETLLSQNQKHLNEQVLEPLLSELAAAGSDGRLQATLDKLPKAEAAALKALLSDASGSKLDASAFSAEMRQVLDSKYLDPGFARQLTGRVKTLVELVNKANEPGASAKSLAAFGNQVLNPKSPVPSTPFQLIDDMRLMQTSLRDIRATLGESGLDLAAQRFADAGREMMADMSSGKLPKTREAVRERIQQVVENVKSEGLNRSLIQGLQQRDQVTETMSAAELSSAVKNNPVLQTSLKEVFDKVGGNLKTRADLKPVLDKLAQVDKSAMSQIQALLAKAGENPATLAGDLDALLSRHLEPAEAQKLQQAILGEMSSQLDAAIGKAEKAQYSRSDTQKAQGALVESLKAFKQVMLASKDLQAVDRQLESAAADAIGNIGANAADLLIKQGILAKGKDALGALVKFFPSLGTGETSEAKLLSELASFSAMSRPQLEGILGKSLSDEQFISFKLAASSMAMSLSVSDQSRGPLAASLGRLTQDLIKNPGLLKDQAQQDRFTALLAAAGKVAGGADGVQARDALLDEIARLSPDAATAGRSQAKVLDGKAATDHRIQAFTGQRITPDKPGQADQSGTQTNPAQKPPTGSQTAAQTTPQTTPAQTDGSSQPATAPAGSDKSNAANHLGILMTSFAGQFDVRLAMDRNDGKQPPAVSGSPDLTLNVRISGPPATQAQRNQAWQAGTSSLADAVDTYRKLPPDRQQAYRAQPGVAEFLDKLEKEHERYRDQTSVYNRKRNECVEEWYKRLDIYKYFYNALANLLQSDPTIVSDMIAKVTEGMEAAYDGQRIAAKLSQQADELAGKLLAPVPDSKQLEKLSLEIEAFLKEMQGYSQQTQQLALLQLSNKMITSAISAFYDQRMQQQNKHHFARLAELSDKLKQTIDAQLQASLAVQSSTGQAAVASGKSGAELGEALNQTLRKGLDEMLATTQQMRPPMMTDFKRAQILQQLFDGDRSNDLPGILAIAGAK